MIWIPVGIYSGICLGVFMVGLACKWATYHPGGRMDRFLERHLL